MKKHLVPNKEKLLKKNSNMNSTNSIMMKRPTNMLTVVKSKLLRNTKNGLKNKDSLKVILKKSGSAMKMLTTPVIPPPPPLP